MKIHRTYTLDLPFGIKKWVKEADHWRKTANWGVCRRCGFRQCEFFEEDPGKHPTARSAGDVASGAHARREAYVREREIDLVLVTAPPFSNVLVVERLRKEFPPPTYRD